MSIKEKKKRVHTYRRITPLRREIVVTGTKCIRVLDTPMSEAPPPYWQGQVGGQQQGDQLQFSGVAAAVAPPSVPLQPSTPVLME